MTCRMHMDHNIVIKLVLNCVFLARKKLINNFEYMLVCKKNVYCLNRPINTKQSLRQTAFLLAMFDPKADEGLKMFIKNEKEWNSNV